MKCFNIIFCFIFFPFSIFGFILPSLFANTKLFLFLNIENANWVSLILFRVEVALQKAVCTNSPAPSTTTLQCSTSSTSPWQTFWWGWVSMYCHVFFVLLSIYFSLSLPQFTTYCLLVLASVVCIFISKLAWLTFKLKYCYNHLSFYVCLFPPHFFDNLDATL